MRQVASDEGLCYMLHVVLERQKHQELIFMWEYNQHFHNNCKIVVIRPTLIKGVCLVCLPLSCLPNLVGRQLWLKDLGVPLLSSPSTAAENLWRVSAFFSAILETQSRTSDTSGGI